MKRYLGVAVAAGTLIAVAVSFTAGSALADDEPTVVVTDGALAAHPVADVAPAPTPKPAPKPCVAKEFKSKTLQEKCEKGGQKAAKKWMKAVTKKGKELGTVKNCKSCHEKLKPNYELKKDAGKLLDEIVAKM